MSRNRATRRWLIGAIGIVLVAGLAVPPAAATTPGSGTRPWQADNLSPASRTVTPTRVSRTTGTVTDPTNVLHSTTTALVGSGSSITLDFGEEVGGLVTVHFGAGSDTGQQLGLAFSESSQYVGTSSDASNGGGGADGAIDASVTPGSSWTMPSARLRGGFRYLTLFANSAGTIDIDHVSLAISFAPDMANLRDYANYFSSSDPLLNRIWYAGAYTVQTNTIAPTTGRV